MGSDETRMLELRQMRATEERNHLHAALGQTQRQYVAKHRKLSDVQSKFKLLLNALKSGHSNGSDERAKLEMARFNAASLKCTKTQITHSKNELLVLDRRKKDLSAEAAKVKMVREKCQERIHLIKQQAVNRQELSIEEELTEVQTARRQNQFNLQAQNEREATPALEVFVPVPTRVGDGNGANLVSTEVVPTSAQSSIQARPQQQRPFEQIEQIQAWQSNGNTSMTLTYRLASGRTLSIEASQTRASVIQVSLAPEFQQDRKHLVRERSRMLAALRDAGLNIDRVEIV